MKSKMALETFHAYFQEGKIAETELTVRTVARSLQSAARLFETARI